MDEVGNLRDRHMADNVTFMLDSLPPHSKVVLWAHNGHIAVGYEALSFKNLGKWLRERYGSQYYAFGLTLGGGTFQTRLIDRENNKVGPLTAFDVPKIDGELWEADLLEISEGDYYFDLRAAVSENEITRRWAMQSKPLLMLDEGYNPSDKRAFFEYACVLGGSFDGIIFTEKTSHARPNPSGKRE